MSLPPLFAGRRAAGVALAHELLDERGPELVVVGLARGGVAVAAEVAGALAAPLDVVAVRKVRDPWQPEYAVGAVTPGDGVYLRGRHDLTAAGLAAAVERAKAEAVRLDRRLHAAHPALDLDGKSVVAVDDGLATGATMIAALRWVRASGAARALAAAPVAPPESLELIRPEADAVVCLHALEPFYAVGLWYGEFSQVDDDEVIRLLGESRTLPALDHACGKPAETNRGKRAARSESMRIPGRSR